MNFKNSQNHSDRFKSLTRHPLAPKYLSNTENMTTFLCVDVFPTPRLTIWFLYIKKDLDKKNVLGNVINYQLREVGEGARFYQVIIIINLFQCRIDNRYFSFEIYDASLVDLVQVRWLIICVATMSDKGMYQSDNITISNDLNVEKILSPDLPWYSVTFRETKSLKTLESQTSFNTS